MQGILKSLKNNSLATGLAGGVSGGLLVGLLGGKKSRKLAGKAVKLGGAAVIGGLAWEAYRRYQQNQGPGDASAGAGTTNWNALEENSFASASPEVAMGQEALIVRTMIAAAQADGNLDQSERLRILERIERSEATLEQKAQLLNDMSARQDLQVLVGESRCPELAIELYVASVLVLHGNNPKDHPHLARLAGLLSLPSDLIDEIHRGIKDTATFGNTMVGPNQSRTSYEVTSHVA